MGQDAVIYVSDLSNAGTRNTLRPGCDKSILHAHDDCETSVFHLAPGGGVPVHLHSRVFDLFVGVEGDIEITYEGQQGSAVVKLKPGAFCAMPPGVRHEVRNVSATAHAKFLLVHAPNKGYDRVAVPFKNYQTAFDTT